MNQLIKAMEDTIRIQNALIVQRKVMLANKDKVLFDKKLPNVNESYVGEMEIALAILHYFNNPIKEWNIADENDMVDVPDDLMPLFDKLGMQLQFFQYSDKPAAATLCSMVAIAQKFFHEYLNKSKINGKQTANLDSDLVEVCSPAQ